MQFEIGGREQHGQHTQQVSFRVQVRHRSRRLREGLARVQQQTEGRTSQLVRDERNVEGASNDQEEYLVRNERAQAFVNAEVDFHRQRTLRLLGLRKPVPRDGSSARRRSALPLGPVEKIQ